MREKIRPYLESRDQILLNKAYTVFVSFLLLDSLISVKSI
uniref:Uncharacterized protein n=1 Tax=Lepeophtheirus salmonis TaxID=72036 RepID=A0A0K2TPQ6_LEPSM